MEVIALMLLLVKNMVGKYTKLTLAQLESKNLLTPEIRKIILDNYNELFREITEKSGSGV